MIALSVAGIARITGGRVAGADPAATVTGPVEFDSRKITEGGLFLAFPGEHVDGHDYVAAAVGNGAVAALVTREVPGPCIVVPDALSALAALATHVAGRLTATTVVGVTGSSGKTSTKDLLAQLLPRLGPTVAPPGSFNNELGHPYTVLRAGADTRFLVLENSARGIGHIRALTQIARPRIGVVLNVGSAHLGEFGSRAAIAQAKGELVEALPAAAAGGVAVLNADDPLVSAMATRTSARVVRFSASGTNDAEVRAQHVSLDELGRATFTLHTPAGSDRVSLQLVGAHHVGNALAAAAVALECGMTVGELAGALTGARASSRWRMELSETADGLTVINDAYNANPESMRAALQALATIGARRHAAGARSFAVLGEMAELGDAAVEAHEQLGRLAASLGVSRVVAVGEPARPVVRGAAGVGGWAGRATWCADAAEAVALLRDETGRGDVVLVKASHAASLERIALAMTEDTAGGGLGAGLDDRTVAADGAGDGEQ